jgi:hypothetical protein
MSTENRTIRVGFFFWLAALIVAVLGLFGVFLDPLRMLLLSWVLYLISLKV